MVFFTFIYFITYLINFIDLVFSFEGILNYLSYVQLLIIKFLSTFQCYE